MRTINKLIVHCSATRPNWMIDAAIDAQVAEIRRWHMEERGWSDIGYHFIIGRDGEVVHGRQVARIGAHVFGENEDSIGICLIGGHGASAIDLFGDHFSLAQDAALRSVIASLQGVFPGSSVSGHNRFAAKACPGFQVAEWFDRSTNWRSAA